MANIPVAGYPTAFPGKSKSVLSLHIVGDKKLANGLEFMYRVMPVRRMALLTELGLYGETATKLRTPVDFGPLRASIGHYRGEPIEAPKDAAEAKAAAHWHVDTNEVQWGSDLEYATYVEFGFTMATRRLVYIERVGFRWVNPFSYRGAHMFHLGVQAAAAAVPKIGERHMNKLWREAIR